MSRYKDQRWLRKRAAILRRDGYMCRECRRYGKTTTATTVHHVYPAEQHPQWWLADWNLISLCTEHANAMHDRKTDRLTTLGLEWQARVSPPGQTTGRETPGTGVGPLFQ